VNRKLLGNILSIWMLSIIFLAIFVGCQKKEMNLAFENIGSDNTISVVKAMTTKAKLPMGNTIFNISNNKIDNNELFGPPVTEAWAKEGHVLLILWVNIKVNSDKEWLDLVNSLHLVDDQWVNYHLDLWYFREAYRVTHFMESAEGLGLGAETRLAFQIKDPLPSGLKLKVNQREVALIK
jgi:hypothetical protein